MPTISIAVPSSCISSNSCGSSLQAVATAHQIARACVQFGVDEIIVYDTDLISLESNTDASSKKIVFSEDEDSKEETKGNLDRRSIFLAALLQFFVTPSYLRKSIFNNLHFFDKAKKFKKLPGLPFLNHSDGQYLEGIAVASKIKDKKMASVIKKKNKTGSAKSKKEIAAEESTDVINVGHTKVIRLDEQKVPTGARVTVDMIKRKVVSTQTAYGTPSFGYSVRLASCFGKIFTESMYSEGYSFTAYVPSDEFTNPVDINLRQVQSPDGEHILFVYGKWKEIQAAVIADTENLSSVENAEMLFDARIPMNRGLRTEDSVMITLSNRN